MSIGVYSGIDTLPQGDAPDTVTEGCLVLEGGALRGVYTNGVLDALMEAGINFRTTYGVSAGSLNGINYAAGQIGRSGRMNLRYRGDSRYVGKDAIRKNRGIFGFDFMFGDPEGVEPLNSERVMHGGRELFAVASCLETAEPEAFGNDKTLELVFKGAQASSSLPYISLPVEIGGKHYLDGGCLCKIPYEFALKRDFETILVVRTRPRSYRKQLKPKKKLGAEKLIFRDYPEFAKELPKANEKYNRQCDELEALEARGRILVIAPSEPVTVTRLEKDIEKLGELYWLGYKDGKAFAEKHPELGK
ncbi:MAG: patatin family protein [Ruminococcus sp.]|nr:patatin family protein [Ruminococcus sp.]